MSELAELVSKYGVFGALGLIALLGLAYWVRKLIDSKFEIEKQSLAGLIKQAEAQFGNLHDARFKVVPIIQEHLQDANRSGVSIRERNYDLGVNGLVFAFSFSSTPWYRLQGLLERNIFLFQKEDIQPLMDAISAVIEEMNIYQKGLENGLPEVEMELLEKNIKTAVAVHFQPAREQAEQLFRGLLGVVPPKTKKR